MDYVRRAEETLGLGDQPRAIVFHIKDGREHCHVVWSRIDADHEKAVHLAFDRDKLMRVTRGFARDHGLTLPPGYEKSRNIGQLSLYERAQLQRTGLSLDDHKRQVTEAWQQSDNARSFVHALSERGYILATGNRPYVVIDLYGNLNALARLIDDKSVRTKDVRAFLEKEFPPEALPSVEEAQKLVADHRRQVEQSVREEDYAAKLAELKHAQQERRRVLERQRETLKYRQHTLRLVQQKKHLAERTSLRHDHLVHMRAVRQKRYQQWPTGLAEFLGRVSGVNFLRHKLERYQDAKRLRIHLDDRAQLKARQSLEARVLALRLKLQSAAIDRQYRSLEKVDEREIASLMRDQQCAQRVRVRGQDGVMPLTNLSPERRHTPVRGTGSDVMTAFENARHPSRCSPPDVMAAFERAAAAYRNESQGQSGGGGLENGKPITPPNPRKNNEPDRER